MTLRKLFMTMMIALLALFAVACSSGDDSTSEAANGESESKDQTITFGVTPWTSTVPPTKVASLILEDMGYEVEEIDADVSSIYVGLSRGEINVYMDSWMPVHEVHLEKYEGKVEDLAVSYDSARSGLVVPTYMADFNSVEDLVGNEDLFGNEVYGVEPGGSAAEIINELIDAYDLDMEQINSSEGGMMAQAMRFMEQEEPVVFYAWRPHTMFNKMDIKMLEDPKEIFNVPSIHVIVDSELKETAPEAYEFLSNWSIDIDDVEAMIVAIEDGEDPEEVARQWIEDNQDKIEEMTK